MERPSSEMSSSVRTGFVSRGVAPTLGLVVLGLWTACAGSLAERHQADLDRLIRARGIEPSEVVFPDRLTEEMRQWLYRAMPPRPGSENRMFELAQALENRADVQMAYASGHTGTAREVFETGIYNCLSYSHLFLAMAREVGVDARYYEVERSRRFHREGDVVLVSGHVTVGFGNLPNEQLLKFTVRSDADYRSARQISDLTALGLYYSNRGSELIADGHLEEARKWLEVAVRLAPHLPGSWVNLGVARRRSGDLEGAEEAYLKAVEIGERFFPAYRNLAALYQLRGEDEMRVQMMNLLDGRGNRNPYTWLALGDHSLDLRRWREAGEFYRRALHLASDPAGPRAALGLLALYEGDREAADEWLEKAKTRGSSVERVEELREALYPEQYRVRPESEIVID